MKSLFDGILSIVLLGQERSSVAWAGHELKAQAGFGKGKEKNFPGIVTEQQIRQLS